MQIPKHLQAREQVYMGLLVSIEGEQHLFYRGCEAEAEAFAAANGAVAVKVFHHAYRPEPEKVRALREELGASLQDAGHALIQAGGDMEEARYILRHLGEA